MDDVDALLHIVATNPGPAFPAHATMRSSEKSLLDGALSSDVALLGFRAALFALRLASTAAPKLPSKIIDVFNERFPDMVAMGAPESWNGQWLMSATRSPWTP